MSLARELAARVVATRYEDLPPDAVYWCKVALMDTIGVTLAGSLEDAPKVLSGTLQPQSKDRGCLLIGSERRVAALDAALINATSAHVLDFDNTAAHMGGHISAILVPRCSPPARLSIAADATCCSRTPWAARWALLWGRGVNFYHPRKAGTRLGRSVSLQ